MVLHQRKLQGGLVHGGLFGLRHYAGIGIQRGFNFGGGAGHVLHADMHRHGEAVDLIIVGRCAVGHGLGLLDGGDRRGIILLVVRDLRGLQGLEHGRRKLDRRRLGIGCHCAMGCAKQEARRKGREKKFAGHESRPFVIRPIREMGADEKAPLGCAIVSLSATLLWWRAVSNKAI